ncbi:hypothetical protein FACS189459_3320 [Bacilli bacterium]|nr:hypothetical protein FACS189459_3320 [Bacilli bacterium]
MKIKKDAGSSHVLYTDTDGDQIGISKTDNHNGDLDINFKTNETVSSNASTKKINEYFNAGLGVIDTATVSLDY